MHEDERGNRWVRAESAFTHFNPLPFPSPVRGNFVRVSRVNFSKAKAFLPALLANRERRRLKHETMRMFSNLALLSNLFSRIFDFVERCVESRIR